MVVAARTVSQVAVHMAIAFSIMYVLTGSVAFGGLAAVLEPVINVALLPLHQRMWRKICITVMNNYAAATRVAAEKTSQLALHMGVAFAVMYFATGSLAFGGLAAVLEPICNVLMLPLHDQVWQKIGSQFKRSQARSFAVF